MSPIVDIAIPVLYAVSMAVLLAYGLNMLVLSVVVARGGRIARLPDRPPLVDGFPGFSGDGQVDFPHVTIQIPLYNEALVARRLIDAVASQDYPLARFEIQVLDDSDDETVDIVSDSVRVWRERGVTIHQIRRQDREGFKAGALSEGLERAQGDLIAIFDADFVPDAGFLRQIVPHFDHVETGMVQARWSHLNAKHSLLTRIQAFGLDAHFAVEQQGRDLLSCYLNFNGTAGVWRRSCIEDAGGWSSATLTEDLDLSYRAQLGGWHFDYDHGVRVPAELPVSMEAFRTQQHRWTKGGLQTAIKMLGPLLGSGASPRSKLEGFLHLTSNIVFPFIWLAALLHAPLVWLQQTGRGPGSSFFAFLLLGLAGFAGLVSAHVIAQRSLYGDWLRRLCLFPLFLAGSIGMAVNNSRAVWEVLRGKSTPFVRTPKFSFSGPEKRRAWWTERYASARLPGIVFVELAMALYSLGGLAYVVSMRQWTAVPFQMLFAAGFLFVSMYNLRQVFAARSGSRTVPKSAIQLPV